MPVVRLNPKFDLFKQCACGEKHGLSVTVLSARVTASGKPSCFVTCDRCKCAGPSRRTREAALDAWAKRLER